MSNCSLLGQCDFCGNCAPLHLTEELDGNCYLSCEECLNTCPECGHVGKPHKINCKFYDECDEPNDNSGFQRCPHGLIGMNSCALCGATHVPAWHDAARQGKTRQGKLTKGRAA